MRNALKIALLMLIVIIAANFIGANGCMWVGNKDADGTLAAGSSGIIVKSNAIYPPNNAVNVPINAWLTWAPANGTTLYDVYFGDVNPPEFRTTITPTNIIITSTPNAYWYRLRYNPGLLNYDTTYYWRIDPKNESEITTGDIWKFTTVRLLPPPPAIGPLPQDRAINVPANTELSWASTYAAVSYDVFFGTANPPDFAATVLRTNYRTRYLPGRLEYSTAYYWRVVAVNDAGTAEGRLWTFTTLIPQPPVGATLPYPPNNTVNMPINLQLSWASHVSALSYDVYFGTAEVPELITNVARTLYRSRYNPGPLAYGITYYWRVDARNNVGVTAGRLWTFRTFIQLPPPPAYAPLPPNNAINVPVNAWLAWGYVFGAASYDVYFGATEEPGFQTNITNTNVVPIYSNISGTDAYRIRYNPGTIEYNTTYYWRIDTKNNVGTTTGPLWRFSTLPTDQGGVPKVRTTPATNITENSATLNGVVNPNGLQTAVYFQINNINSSGVSGGRITPPQSIGSGTDDVNITFDITDLVANNYYTYRCYATNLLGTVYGAFFTFSTFAPPVAPSNLSATAANARQVDLSWTDNSNNENGFIIERSLDGISFTYLMPINWDGVIAIYPPPPQAPRNATTFTDFRVQPNTTYYYRLYAVNQAGRSEFSNVAQATTPEPPPPPPAPNAPSDLTATVITYGGTTGAYVVTAIRINWVDNSDNETGFVIERSLDGITFTYLWPFNQNNQERPIIDPPPPQVGPNVTSFTDYFNIQLGTTYYYRVAAVNQSGRGDYSNVAQATTPEPPPPPPAPNAPSELTAEVISYTGTSNWYLRIRLNWVDNSDNENGFVIERSLDGITFTYLPATNIAIPPPPTPLPPQVGPNATTFTDYYNIRPGTTYYYRIYAVNQAGRSEFSNVAQATTPPPPQDNIPPTRPISLTAVIPPVVITIYPPLPPVVQLNWAASTDNVGVVGYRIFRINIGSNGGTVNPPTQPYATVPGDVTTFLDTNVAPQNYYGYTVVAFDATGNASLPSNPANIFIPGW